MSETVATYDIKNPDKVIPMDRAEFYRQQIENYEKGIEPTRAVGVVNVFVFDSVGELFIQKRSNTKAHNAGLFDKSMGGHIRFGDNSDYTVMVETIQELQVPSIVLRTHEDFSKTHDLLSSYLSTVSIIEQIDSQIYSLPKTIKGSKIPILNKVHLYFGVYDGAVSTVDREAKGVVLYSLDDIKGDIKKSPDLFTYDLAFLIKKYHSQIEKFIKIIKAK